MAPATSPSTSTAASARETSLSRRERSATPQRLGVYVDDVYRLSAVDGRRRISGDRAFVLFVAEVGTHFDGLILFGRAVESEAPADYVLPADVRLAPLPYYHSVRQVRRLAAVLVRTVRGMWAGIADVEVVWAFGPHPFALVLAMLARLRGRRAVLGVRQDTLEDFRARLSSRRWTAILLGIRLLDLVFRAAARRFGVTVVGETIARQYPSSAKTLAMKVTLVREADVAAAPPELDWMGRIELLTISRLDGE